MTAQFLMRASGLVGSSSEPLLLDTGIATPVLAYSTRKLRAAYSGYCLRVLRLNDNATQDIGFVNDELDTAAIATFIGANSAVIDIWYDQSGSLNGTQVTDYARPIIANSGTLVTMNGKTAFDTYETNYRWVSTGAVAGFSGVSQFTCSYVGEAAATNDSSRLATTLNGTDPDYVGTDSAILFISQSTLGYAGYRASTGYASNTIPALNTPFTATSWWGASQHKVYTNGGEGAGVSYTPVGLAASLEFRAPESFNGKMGEVLFWSSALSDGDLATLHLNQATYWGTLRTGAESDGTSMFNGGSGMTSDWITVAATFTTATGLAPDGTTNAALLTESATTNRHIVYQNVTPTGDQVFSVYAKANGRRYIQLNVAQADDLGRVIVYVDLQTGTVTDTEVAGVGVLNSTSVELGANGFYKISVSSNVSATPYNTYFTIALSDVATYGSPLNSTSPEYAGDGTSGVYLWRPKIVD
jgi:hypothetical protein